MRYENKLHTFKSFFEDIKHDNASGEEFWGDVGAGILPICTNTGRILVSFRSEDVNEPHTWGIFGGRLEEDETPEEAANREMEEEGVTGHFKIIPAYVFKSQRGGFSYHNFIGIIDEEFDPELTWETEDWKWVSLDELKKLEPKHFGLKALIENSISLIKKYAE